MLPSSGAWQLSTNGPYEALAASACTIASSTWPRPMPPHSFGICGSHSPASLAAWRMPNSNADVLLAIHPLGIADLRLARLDDLVDERSDSQPDVFQFGREREVDGHARHRRAAEAEAPQCTVAIC